MPPDLPSWKTGVNPALSRNCIARYNLGNPGPEEEIMYRPIIFIFLYSHFIYANSTVELEEVLVADAPSETQIVRGENYDSLKQAMEGQSSVYMLGGQGTLNMSTSIFVRGLEARHTVITLDGAQLKDPAATDSQMNFSVIDLNEVEDITISTGEEGVIESNQAVAGLVQLQTPNSLKSNISIETERENAVKLNHAAQVGNSTFLFMGKVAKSNSLARSHATGGEEKDPFEYKNFSIKWMKNWNDQTYSSTFFKSYDNKMELDPNPKTDGEDDRSKIKFYLLNHKTGYFFEDGAKLEHRISYLKNQRQQESAYGEFDFDSSSLQNEANLDIGEVHFIVKHDEDRFSTESISEKTASFADIGALYSKKKIDVKLSGVTHSEFGDRGLAALAYRVFPAKNLEIEVSGNTAFTPPSLYQLYGPAVTGSFSCEVGNTDLSPELGENLGIKVTKGASKHFLQGSIFSQKVNNYIRYNCDQGYVNELNMNSNGYELQWEYQVEAWKIGAQFGHFNFFLSSGAKILRRPNDKFSFFVEVKNFKLNARWIGERYDTDNVNIVEVEPVSLVDLAYSWQRQNHEITTELLNLTNANDESVYGFSGRGRLLRLAYSYYY